MERVLGTKTDEEVEESTFIWCIKWSNNEAVNFKEVLFIRYNKNSWKWLTVDTAQVSEMKYESHDFSLFIQFTNTYIK